MGRLHCLSQTTSEGRCIQRDVGFGIDIHDLMQTFQSYMQFKEIPRKLIVAKRLSQCLNPALPTGVHQRALDVYSHILRVLGVSDLAASGSG